MTAVKRAITDNLQGWGSFTGGGPARRPWPRWTYATQPDSDPSVSPGSLTCDGGTQIVPRPFPGGTWHISGGQQCYEATLASTDTSNIIDNNNFTGPDTESMATPTVWHSRKERAAGGGRAR